MAALDTPTVAQLLREFAGRASLRGGNPYRAKAYARAADSLGALDRAAGPDHREGRLKEIPGVGDAIADIITKLHRTGTHPSLEAMRKDIPAGVLEMLAVPGLRPDKVLKLYKELGITSLAELEAAAREDRLKGVKGLGRRLQAKILQNLDIARSGEGRRHLHRAALLLENAERSLRQAHPELTRITLAGRLPARLRTGRRPRAGGRSARARRGTGNARSGGGLTVHLTDKRHYGVTLLFATGSSQHIEELQALAARKGLTLDGDGSAARPQVLAARKRGRHLRRARPALHRARAARGP